ncbi:MAG: site-specific integrase [Candidatus Nitrosotenuis sp.]
MEKEFSENNLRVVKDYDKAMVLEGLGLPTRYLHLNRMLSLTRRLKKDWKDATKQDIENVIFEIMNTYSDGGKDTEYTYDHKKVLKIFFRWFKFGSRKYKYCLKKFRAGDPPETEDIVMNKPENKLKGSDLISGTEREWILDACELNRDKALIDIPLDGGIRPGELLSLCVKHVSQDKHGFLIYVEGKTGTRTVRLIRSTPSLITWIAEHPYRNNPDAPLFINLKGKNVGKPLAYASARQVILRVSENVRKLHPQFSKRVFLNLFRHTEATDAAKFMKDQITKKRHGWSPTSKMPARYSHLLNDDVEDVIFERYGIKTNKEEKPKLPIECMFCNRINPVHLKICSQCGRALTLEAAYEIDEKSKESEETLKKQIAELQEQVKNNSRKIDVIQSLHFGRTIYKEESNNTPTDSNKVD